jgi:hypothetical protein
MTRVRSKTALHRLIVIALLASVSATGCMNLGHIQVLRDSQDRFSQLAADENAAALRSLAPATLDPAHLTASVGLDQAVVFYRGFRGVYLDLHALQQRAGRELEKDNLAASASILELLAFWRMVFNGHLATALSGEGPQELLMDAGAAKANDAAELPSLASVRELAKKARSKAESEQLPVFPRDAFLMSAVPALLRYDIAYLNAIVASSNGTLTSAGSDADQKTATEIIDQMVVAEGELADLTGGKDVGTSVRKYGLLARLRMLVNAKLLAAHVKLSAIKIQAGALPKLRERSCQLRKDVEKLGGAPAIDLSELLHASLCAAPG